MTFLSPSVLWALTLLVIPVIIHLFSFRRYKTVWFPDIRFLQQIEEETASRNNLKQLLVLIARLLAFAFLILAFAQPFIPNANTEVNKGNAISIYVDNSYSMESDYNGRRLIDIAKEKALEIIELYSIDDEFHLITNNPDINNTRLLSMEEIKDRINGIEISSNVIFTSDALSQQDAILNKSQADNKQIFQISDFQKNTTNYDSNNSFPLNLVSVKGKASANINLDTAYFVTPVQVLGEKSSIVFGIKNYSEENRKNVTINLEVNDQTKGIKSIDIPANSSMLDTITFTITSTGRNKVLLSIEDYPVMFDDRIYLSFEPVSKVKVSNIKFSDASIALESVYNQKVFELKNYTEGLVDYNSVANTDLIVLNGVNVISSGLKVTLNNALNSGASVAVIPGANMDKNSINEFVQPLTGLSISRPDNLKNKVSKIDIKHPLFEGVFEKIPENLLLPVVNNGYKLTGGISSNYSSVILFEDGSPFMSATAFDNGSIYLFASPFSSKYTDFAKQGALFVPVIYRMALLSKKSYLGYFSIGEDQWVALNTDKDQEGEGEFIVSFQEKTFIPSVRKVNNYSEVSIGPYATEAGFYTIYSSDDTVLTAANYKRLESDTHCYSKGELEELGGNIVSVSSGIQGSSLSAIRQINEGRPLWKFCVIFTLFFLAAEVLLIRFWP